MASEPRQSQRVNAEVAVRLQNNASGVTRDISPSGVYFVVNDSLQGGQMIRFTLEFDDPAGGPLHLDCVGQVVRVEEAAGKKGVAVMITESSLVRRPPGNEPERLVATESASGGG
jgi:hypothetical protein